MGFNLVHLFEAVLLFMNAFSILNEKRFLRLCLSFTFIFNFIFTDGMDKPHGATESLKNQVATFLYAIRSYLRCLP